MPPPRFKLAVEILPDTCIARSQHNTAPTTLSHGNSTTAHGTSTSHGTSTTYSPSATHHHTAPAHGTSTTQCTNSTRLHVGTGWKQWQYLTRGADLQVTHKRATAVPAGRGSKTVCDVSGNTHVKHALPLHHLLPGSNRNMLSHNGVVPLINSRQNS